MAPHINPQQSGFGAQCRQRNIERSRHCVIKPEMQMHPRASPSRAPVGSVRLTPPSFSSQSPIPAERLLALGGLHCITASARPPEAHHTWGCECGCATATLRSLLCRFIGCVSHLTLRRLSRLGKADAFDSQPSTDVHKPGVDCVF